MEPIHRPTAIGTYLLLLSVVLSISSIQLVQCGCRMQDRNPCETVCQWNVTRNSYNCTLRVIVILPKKDSVEASLPRVMPVLELAEREVRRRQLIPSDLTIKWIPRDDKCDPSYASISAMDGYGIDCGHVLFGPTCDYALAPVSRIAKYFRRDGTPLLTVGGFTYDFVQNKTTCEDEYHMLIRVGLLSFQTIADFTVDIMKNYGWHRVVFFYDRNGHYNVGGLHTCHLLMQTMANTYRKKNITYSSFVTDSAVGSNTTENLKREIGLDQAIVMMCASPGTIREIMLAADDLNMIDSGEYVFFNIELYSGKPVTNTQPWYNASDTDENNLRAKKAYTALLTVVGKQTFDDEYMQFSQQLKELAASNYNFTFPENQTVSTFVTAFYDAVFLYAYALNDSIKMDPQALYKPINGTHLAHLMWNRSFNGITGKVIIDKNGDRISDYSLLDMDPETGYFHVVANYFNHSGLEYVEGRKIHWAGGRTDPPPDKPKCGFDNSLCPALPGYAILSFVLGMAMAVMAIISFFGYRHYKLEAEIYSMAWKVSWNDVLPCNQLNRQRGSVYSLAKRGSQLTVYSEELGSLAGDKQLFIPSGFYKGCKVAIKRINEKNIHLNRAQMLELKKMKDIHHEHLVKFYGACVDPPNCCILTEYCPKGSLQDILENDQIKLDWMFKISLMHDIVRGMHYLHSTDIRSHGNLKSSNCVVDSRFVLKIADFGLHSLRKSNNDEDSEYSDSYAHWRSLLWTAPELLRMKDPPVEGTQKADVYSFGIIVNEIATRQGPFYTGNSYITPKEIIERVKRTAHGAPFRPTINDQTFDDLNNIMTKCWKEDPTERPDFSILKTTIRKVNKENETGNIVDNLLKRMEQYANNLEGLVEERTQDYLEEKRKCEELLYQLLPKSVAAQLILGKPVIAEVFEQVTIYFSDVVGFTQLSAASTPMQVVDLLNDLYTCFDSIIENFDVYKVETIGDAYMMVSGLPQRNGDKHAREIARTAIALLNNVYKFKIRHRSNEQLKLRIGIHSGPCVAGVVGLKMPRYCLFGDTVNTASRMESNGEPLKIHISQSTKTILDKFGTFDIAERGLVEMKGKGKLRTYWLQGEQHSELYTSTLNNAIAPAVTPNYDKTKDKDPLTMLRTGIMRSRSNSLIPPNDLKSRSNSLVLLTPSSPSNTDKTNQNASIANATNCGSVGNTVAFVNALTNNNQSILNNLVKTNNLKNCNLSNSSNKLKINNNVCVEDNGRSVTIPLLASSKS
ncbi:atrial natriuretic peptide receptor 1-like isoform X1 [Contarinia nasturtii]|uniref:atrial natriuretic peptide receptor 1-like isoform X1 n=1 Tax=Contarinia nasturtii TaxID=265458 RepID=UPI0012D48687|nr:atrial natriuretic peptide receptor 1-like isoform X1 [Contarinia nasturtii]XP_031626435.1 atrial natriuretic peptide receptor 1-like isoform X1 [Contarinia nasturtii]